MDILKIYGVHFVKELINIMRFRILIVFLYNLEYEDEVKQYVRDLISNGTSEDYERKDRVFKKILTR